MSPVMSLVAFGLRQVFGDWTDAPVEFITERLTDHGQKLRKALASANDRAWKALSIALAGDGLFDHVKNWLAPADERAFAEQVRSFLHACPLRSLHRRLPQEMPGRTQDGTPVGFAFRR